MKACLILAIGLASVPSLAASAGEELISSAPVPRVCVMFPDRRTSSRRICLTSSQWQARLGPDWRQIVTGRNFEDDMDALSVRTRNNPRLPQGACNVC